MILPTRMAPLPRSLAVTAALLLAGALASLLVPSANAQTEDSALAPSNLTAELVEGQVSLDWDVPAEDAGAVTGYEVLRRPLNGEDTLSTLVADTGNADTSFVDATANEPGVRYTYRVKALRGGVKSRESNHAYVDTPESTPQPADPKGGSGEDGVYTWRDGDRIMTVRLEPSEDAQKSPPVSGGKSVRTVDRSGGDAGPVFRSESGGGSMTLPGGVLLVLDPSWTGSDADAFFSRNGIKRSRVTELTFTKNAYFVETAPGLPSLRLANSLAERKGVEISSPNWRSEVAASQEDPEDDGDTIETATDLPLNTRLEATLHSPADMDFFRIELSEPELVVIADIDSDNDHRLRVNFTMLDSSGAELRHEVVSTMIGVRRLEAGVYYIKASENPYYGPQPYNIQAITLPDHGDTFESAATLNLMAEYDPLSRFNLDYLIYGDFHSPDDEDFFKVELSADAEVFIEVMYPNHLLDVFGVYGLGYMTYVNVDAFDDAGNPLHPPIPGLGTMDRRSYSLEAGTYYFRLSSHPLEKWGSAYPTRTHYYGVLLYGNAEYAQFIDDCSSIETAFDDPLLGCQGHLRYLYLNEVWATNKEEGINIAVVDVTMESAHADLRDNVNETLNHDYTEEDQIINPRISHGTAVAGIIAARDNDLGVRGVAPRATIYNYNYLENTTTANLVDAMTRNMAATAISNNSYGKRSRGSPIHRSQVWNLALETGVSEGFDGKGTFYVFAAGNEHLAGSHVNLREDSNFYAQTTVCAVDSHYTRVDYSETGYALWVCAPMAEVTADNRSRYRYDFSGTSSAAPVVSGVAALARSANPSLTWRDVKLVLAASARQNDPANSGWEEGALQYGSETERYSYNPEYGFGVVDAKAAVDLAESWTNLPPMETARVRSGEIELAIPDPSGGAAPTPVLSRLTLGPEVGFTEFVEVHVAFDHPSFRDLEVELHSPTGTVSKLAVPDEGVRGGELRTTFRFGSARHLGEDPSGEWTLKLTDHLAGQEGSIRWWSIKVYGHGEGVATQPSNSPATGAPGISGRVRVGDTLSADVSSVDDWDGLGGATFSYLWIRNDRTADTDTDIPGATEATYTLVADDEGHTVKVRVTFTDDNGYRETLTSRATAAVEPLPLQGFCDRTQQVRDAILSRIRGVFDCSLVEIWHLNNLTANLVLTRKGIAALQAGDFHDLYNVPELHLDQNDLNALPDGVFDDLRGLDVLALDGNGLSELPEGIFDNIRYLRELHLDNNDLSELPDGVFDDFINMNVLSLDGNDLSELPDGIFDRLGEYSGWVELHLNGNDLSELPDGIFDGLTNLRQMWLHSNPGAPFTLTAELERRSGTAVVVRVAQGAPFDIEVSLSATGGALSATTVTIGGSSTRSDEVAVTPDGDGTVTVSVVSAALQVKPDGTAKGVQVRAGDPLTLTEGEGGNTPAVGAPTISGTAQVGETLAADTSGISDEDGLNNGGFLYQWIASSGTTDAELKDATEATYTPPANDENKTVRVRVSFTDDAGNEETLTSAPTEPVLGPNTPATGLPTISGTARVGETLTVSMSGIEDADGMSGAVFSYQWVSSDGTTGTDIDKATASTYILVADDAGTSIRVRVSFTDDAGSAETLTSAPTEPVLGPNTPATGLPTISGTARVGETLTVSTSGIEDADGLGGAAFSYQWVSSDGTTGTDIDKATDSTYKLVAADQGKTIEVRVTFTDDAGNEETLTSTPTEPVLDDGPPGAPGKLTITAGDRELTLSWEPPDDNGNASGRTYRVTEWRMEGQDSTLATTRTIGP